MRFSQRIGKTPVRTALQIGSIDDQLMNRLWNLTLEDFFYKLDDNEYSHKESERSIICGLLWKEFFGFRIDRIPYSGYSNNTLSDVVINYIQEWYFKKAKWFEVYDFIEFISKPNFEVVNTFITKCNNLLEKQMAGYRVIDRMVVQITSEQEILALEEALDNTYQSKSVNTHLKASLEFLSDRQTPDYRNSIKESISAVEALCKIITGDDKATLGKALAVIEKQHGLHGSLKEAYSKIYGYTSDAAGIRHSMLEDGVDISFEDAKFMLVSCSAFINYLKSKLKI